MKHWGLLTSAALVAGCAGSPVANMINAQTASMPTPAPKPPETVSTPATFIEPSPSPYLKTFNSNAWKTYEDYGYSFRYHDEWVASDWPVSAVTSANGIKLKPPYKAKSAIITSPFSFESGRPPAIGCVWLLGTEESFDWPSDPTSETPISEPVKLTLNGVTWAKLVAQEFKDGRPRTTVMAALRRDGVLYMFFLTGNDGQSLEDMHMYMDTILSTWSPKSAPQVFPASPSPTPVTQ